MASPWRFYVYLLKDESGVAQYVGKGSGNRLLASVRQRGCQGFEIARFKREADAYAFEVRCIDEMKPVLNRHKGGNGSKAALAKASRATAFDRTHGLIGSRAMAARLWLAAAKVGLGDASKVGEIREVAYGAR